MALTPPPQPARIYVNIEEDRCSTKCCTKSQLARNKDQDKYLISFAKDTDTMSVTSVDTKDLTTLSQIRQRHAPILSVIVPTFNEAGNVRELARRLDGVLAGLDWEAVFVDDDSTDGTYEILRELARTDVRIRVLHRIGRRGLASAVVEGVQSTTSPFVAVIDADLQHDEKLLPDMLARLRPSDCDVVVGSRYIAADGLDKLERSRQIISRIATKLAQIITRANLSDPMSGFFMLKRNAFDRSQRHLSSVGYKILLDILTSARPALSVVELPYVFRNRVAGESKLDSAVTWEYVILLLDKTVGRFVPVRFFMFALVGGVGVIVHMLVLAILNQALDVSFVTSQAVAAVAAMTYNFVANNALTYRDKRLRGAWPMLGGLLSFYAVCAIGAVANVGIADFLFVNDHSWWLSGIAGILVSAVWNYAASSVFTWRK
jgi:dolichol-phosphate mannosyltransferase